MSGVEYVPVWSICGVVVLCSRNWGTQIVVAYVRYGKWESQLIGEWTVVNE